MCVFLFRHFLIAGYAYHKSAWKNRRKRELTKLFK